VVHPRAGVLVAVLAAASAVGWWAGTSRAELQQPYTVVRVIDGDTIVVRSARADRGETTVRLLGVDTPEIHHPTKPVQCYGPEAARYTTQRLSGRTVQLQRDRVTTDKYGRQLAYVILDGARFNDELLRTGYARLLVIPPNGRFGRTMLREELEARRAHLGLWGAC